MSWSAKRYANPERFQAKLPGTNTHHVPPRHPDSFPRFLKRVKKTHHDAYHLLFSAAASYEDACAILKRDWWTPPNLIVMEKRNGQHQ